MSESTHGLKVEDFDLTFCNHVRCWKHQILCAHLFKSVTIAYITKAKLIENIESWSLEWGLWTFLSFLFRHSNLLGVVVLGPSLADGDSTYVHHIFLLIYGMIFLVYLHILFEYAKCMEYTSLDKYPQYFEKEKRKKKLIYNRFFLLFFWDLIFYWFIIFYEPCDLHGLNESNPIQIHLKFVHKTKKA